MNILYISEFFPPERVAGARRAFFVTTGLSKNGHNVTVLTTYPNFPSGKRFKGIGKLYNKRENISENLEILRFPIIERPNTSVFNRLTMYASFLLFGFLYFIFHINEFRNKKFDVTVGSSGPIFVLWLSLLISKILRTKLVVEYRDLGYIVLNSTLLRKNSIVNSIFEKIELFPARYSDAIIVVTKGFKKVLLNKGFVNKNIFVITNGIIPNPSRIKPFDSHKNSDKLVIGYFGTFGFSQNLLIFVKAIKYLKDLPVSFIMVGDGAEKDLINRIIPNDDANNIKIYNSLPYEELERFYDLCDICLVSLKSSNSFSFTIPSKIFDIMLHKKPILFVGPEGEASEIISEAKSGICIFTDDPCRISTVLKNLFDSDYKKSFLEMGESGYNFVVRNYNWEKLISKYEDILHNTSK